MRACIYARVSTNEQTTINQLTELKTIVSDRGWRLTKVYEDQGVSGAKGRDKRSGFDQLWLDMSNDVWDILVIWDSTRLSRSLLHLLSFINDLNEADKKIYIAQSNLDTSTPAGKMMVSVLGAFGEYERGMISERIKAGLKRTRTEGTRLGRPRLAMDQDTRQTIHDIYTAGHTIAHIVRTTGITRRRIDVELGRA